MMTGAPSPVISTSVSIQVAPPTTASSKAGSCRWCQLVGAAVSVDDPLGLRDVSGWFGVAHGNPLAWWSGTRPGFRGSNHPV